jgi:hypothetical protein
MEATELLKQEHRQLMAVFDELELTVDALACTRLLAQLAELLKVHAAVEEEVFYPAVRASGGTGAAEIVDEGWPRTAPPIWCSTRAGCRADRRQCQGPARHDQGAHRRRGAADVCAGGGLR